ncbi:cobalamin-binding protein [Aeromicrobium sp. YIM 150415]|uniref:Cobalamin-binding protein n=1 Tax=Aeromicrobium piscarium TaxID=2590901 RepID=A0A554S8E7_9ACTN|nr:MULTISPECIES: helical backbone metal receptor [Aeromicrobium]MBM9465194.1 cobalamin-binding protein [Aeromicrobium sp. YIM 150415]TSD62603.1 cobalamin-binding protein [Aeromicrobium piscarium]
MRDDLGAELITRRPVRRVVSLVPSLTEAMAVTEPDAVVGATDWCTHPAGLDVTRVRGTKNPNLDLISSLRPDLVVANQEENRELDVQRLRAEGIPVWVTHIETLDEAFSSMRRLFTDGLSWGVPDWLTTAEEAWATPASAPRGRAAVAVWRDPWMVVGSSTFTGDVMQRLGLENVFEKHEDRYPHVELSEIDRDDIDLVLLPDEPYVFTADDGPEAFSNVRTVLCSGRSLTWYGPSLLTAREELESLLN